MRLGLVFKIDGDKKIFFLKKSNFKSSFYVYKFLFADEKKAFKKKKKKKKVNFLNNFCKNIFLKILTGGVP